jgi:hypothetical protein
MKTIQSICIVSIFLFFSSVGLAQSKIGLTAGVNYIDLQTITNPEDFGEMYRYLVPLEGKEKLTPSIGLKFEQNINDRFYADYQFRYFFKIFEYDENPTPSILPDIAGTEPPYQTRLFVSTQSVAFSMNLNSNFNVGLGGFIKIIGREPVYLFRIKNSSPSRLAGFLLKSSYKFKKWQIEARYLKGIGDASGTANVPDFKAMDTIELSVSYMFFRFKRKEK